MSPKLRPGELLDELFERSKAARQRDEGVRLGEHQLLPLMHVVHHDQLLGLDQHMLALAQEAGDDAGDVAAMAKRRMCGLAHEPKAASTVDQADAALSQDAAEGTRGLGKGWIAAL